MRLVSDRLHSRTRQARHVRFAQVRLYALLVLLLPLFGALQAIADAGIPRVEIRVVSRDVQVPFEVVVERVVERLVLVPVPGLGFQPGMLANWDISRLPQAGTPLFRTAQAAIRSAGASVTPQLASAPIFLPQGSLASRLVRTAADAAAQDASSGGALRDPITVAVAGVSLQEPAEGDLSSPRGPLGLRGPSSTVVRPASGRAAGGAATSSGSVVFVPGAVAAADLTGSMVDPASGAAPIFAGAPVSGTLLSEQPGPLLAIADPSLVSPVVSTPTPTMVLGPIRRQPILNRKETGNDNLEDFEAFSLSDPPSKPITQPDPPAPNPAPVVPPPLPPDTGVTAPTKTPAPAQPPAPTATPEPPDQFRPAPTPVPPTPTSRVAPTPKPPTATPRPSDPTPVPPTATSRVIAAPTKTPTPKANPPTPKPATATPKPATATPKPKTPTPKPATATPKPKTPTPKPATATPKPATATPKPATATPKPATATPKPATATPKPATATPKPATATPKASGNSKPATATPAKASGSSKP